MFYNTNLSMLLPQSNLCFRTCLLAAVFKFPGHLNVYGLHKALFPASLSSVTCLIPFLPMQSISLSCNTVSNFINLYICLGFPGSSVGKESACNAVDPGSIPGWGSSPGKGIGYPLQYCWASLVAQLVKNSPAKREPGFDPWVGKIPWRRAWQPTLVFLPGESPWTEEPGRLQYMGSQRVGHD